MKSNFIPLFVITLCFGLGFGCAQQKPPDSFTKPQMAVVRIHVAGDQLHPAREGLGFLITEDGMIATADYCAQPSETIRVTLSDGRSFPAQFVQADREGKIGLLQIAEKKLPFLPLQEDEFLPGVPVRVAGIDGIIHGEFEQFENLGDDVGFTTDGTVESGLPLLLDDGTVIGVTKGPYTARPGEYLATPVWRLTRMLTKHSSQ